MTPEQKEQLRTDLIKYLASIEPAVQRKQRNACVEWAFGKTILKVMELGYDINDLDWFKYSSYEEFCLDNNLPLTAKEAACKAAA